MHVVLFRYSARVVKLDCIAHKNVLVIAPENQRKKYDSYGQEGHPLPKVIFLEDFVLPNIIAEIRKIKQNEVIESITTLSEEDIDIAGFLHDHFVCHNSKAVSNLLFKDKYYMRSFLYGVVKQPYFRLLASKEDMDYFWEKCRTRTAVLKPRNLAGAMGIKKIGAEDVVGEEYYNGNYLIEECVDIDKMITCDGYALGQQIKRFYIHEYEELLLDSLRTKGYYLIRTSTLYEKGKDFLQVAYEACQKVLEVFSVEGEITPFHFEWFYDFRSKEIVFCEVGKRFGGGDIPQLILDSYGVDVIKEYWEILTDKAYLERIDYSDVLARPQRISATFSLYREKGKVIGAPSQDTMNWANKVYIFVKPGDSSNEARDVVENSMLVQFSCLSEAELKQRVEELRNISKAFKYQN
ncbi:carboxylate--amine ligase [Atopobacter sp. AH10]|uniref:carboxylate--amine ligase n=1 Tax=Atopobacter sp. AH10 TaxID=2315861 RepID=UPI000EF1D3A5|nr:carboxylate--amine ligase [Atopobacter sp. AH10]RLK63983.1 carboxylate--amine ligase [Atopobacter sp. AH10]